MKTTVYVDNFLLILTVSDILLSFYAMSVLSYKPTGSDSPDSKNQHPIKSDLDVEIKKCPHTGQTMRLVGYNSSCPGIQFFFDTLRRNASCLNSDHGAFEGTGMV